MAEESKHSSAVNNAGEMIKTLKTNDKVGAEAGQLIEIKVLFLARARYRTGSTDTSLRSPAGSTVAMDCMSKLLTKFPKLEEIYNSMVSALNEEYAPESDSSEK